MKKTERTEMIKKLTESLDESMNVYETCQAQGKSHPWAGNDIPLHDSRDSMLRRFVASVNSLPCLPNSFKRRYNS